MRLLTSLTKSISQLSKALGIGAGGTWPGEIALSIDGQFVEHAVSRIKKGIIIVAGTNGKTTTSLLITQMLESAGNVVVHNNTGANLLNGIASSLIKNATWSGEISSDYGVFEVDENSLPLLTDQLQKYQGTITVVLLNLFRDQLDRYGEVDVIAEKWQKALSQLPAKLSIIANGDDPLIVYLTQKYPTIYFGIEERKFFQKNIEHATDSIYCPNCGAKLHYGGSFFSHLGMWKCGKCDFKRPKITHVAIKAALPGLYNIYNTNAAVLTAQQIGIPEKIIVDTSAAFTPAFGRQEEFIFENKKIKLFLSKNPAGYNASLRTALDLKAKHILLLLNDRIPDGTDVSWIWDVDFEMIPKSVSVSVSGDRVYDLAVRLKYAGANPTVDDEVSKALEKALQALKDGETLSVLATYSAMLDIRKILTGKKIL